MSGSHSKRTSSPRAARGTRISFAWQHGLPRNLSRLPDTPFALSLPDRQTGTGGEQSAEGASSAGEPIKDESDARLELRPLPGSSASVDVATAGTWGLAGRGTLLAANLVATPFIIRLLGPSRYGLWALVQSAIIWAGLSDLGMSATTTKFGTERYALGDARGEASVVWTAASLVLVTTGLVAVVLAAGAHLIMQGLLESNLHLLEQGTVALRLGCAIVVVRALAEVVNTPQLARLRWRRFTVLNTGTNLMAIVGTPLALFVLGGGVVTAAGIGLVVAVVYALSMFHASAKVQPALWHPQVNMATARQLAPYGAALTVASVAAIVLNTGERFVLASNHSTTVVAYYAIAATVATTLSALPEQVTAPLLPGLARLETEGRLEELRTLYKSSLAGIFLVVTPAAVLLGLVAQPFLSVWAGPTFASHSTVPLLIALGGVWADSLAWAPMSYLMSSGRTKAIAVLNTSQVLPYLAAAWFLTSYFGAVGAAFVWSARLLLSAAALFGLAWRAARLPALPLSDRRTRSVLAPVTLAAVCVAAAILTRGLAWRCGLAVVLGSAYVVSTWRFVLSPRERRGLSSLASTVLGSRTSPMSRRYRKGAQC